MYDFPIACLLYTSTAIIPPPAPSKPFTAPIARPAAADKRFFLFKRKIITLFIVSCFCVLSIAIFVYKI